jgi:hypothetical protein
MHMSSPCVSALTLLLPPTHLTQPTVLNPSRRLGHAHDLAEDETQHTKIVILDLVCTLYHYTLHAMSQPFAMQMRRHCAKKLKHAGATTTPMVSLPADLSSQVERQKRRAAKAPPSKFSVEPSVRKKRTGTQPTQDSTVEAEFERYAMGEVSPDNCDVLQFWEVCQMQLNCATLISHSLSRPTGLNSQHCSQSPWTTSQSRERLWRVSAYSRLQRRPTPRGETNSAQ